MPGVCPARRTEIMNMISDNDTCQTKADQTRDKSIDFLQQMCTINLRTISKEIESTRSCFQFSSPSRRHSKQLVQMISYSWSFICSSSKQLYDSRPQRTASIKRLKRQSSLSLSLSYGPKLGKHFNMRF